MNSYITAKIKEETAMTTISYILATGLSLVIISWSTIFIVFSYTRAAVRGASERASRAGVIEYQKSSDKVKTISVCESTFKSDIEQAIKGKVAKSLKSRCEIQDNELHVISTTSVSSITSLFPNLSVDENTFRDFESVPS
jgi:hypothetical protein